MSNKEYRSGDKKVIIENNKVTYSDTQYCIVGQKPNMDFLKRAGWYLVKVPKPVYAKGLKDGRNYY